jgi:hypothetical protein
MTLFVAKIRDRRGISHLRDPARPNTARRKSRVPAVGNDGALDRVRLGGAGWVCYRALGTMRGALAWMLAVHDSHEEWLGEWRNVRYWWG